MFPAYCLVLESPVSAGFHLTPVHFHYGICHFLICFASCLWLVVNMQQCLKYVTYFDALSVFSSPFVCLYICTLASLFGYFAKWLQWRESHLLIFENREVQVWIHCFHLKSFSRWLPKSYGHRQSAWLKSAVARASQNGIPNWTFDRKIPIIFVITTAAELQLNCSKCAFLYWAC